MESRSWSQRHEVFWQQPAICRILRMKRVRRFAIAQMNGRQGGEIIGVYEVAGLHSRIRKLRAKHLAKSIARQPGQEGSRYAEAPEADRDIEARSTRMRFVREVATNRAGRCEVDKRITCDNDSRI